MPSLRAVAAAVTLAAGGIALTTPGAHAAATCPAATRTTAVDDLYGAVTRCAGSYAQQIANGATVASLTDEIDRARAEQPALGERLPALTARLAEASAQAQEAMRAFAPLMPSFPGFPQDPARQEAQTVVVPDVTVVVLASDDRPADVGMATLGAFAVQRELETTTRIVAVRRARARAVLRGAVRTSGTVIVVGRPLLSDATAAARIAPKTRVIVIDDTLGRRPAGPPNVTTVGFDQQAAGRIAGYLAASSRPADRPAVVATLGVGADTPTAARLRRGFREGALGARPTARVLGATLRRGAPARSCAAATTQLSRAGAHTVFVLSGPRCAAAASRVPGVSTIVDARRSATNGEAATVITRLDLAIFHAVQRVRVRHRQGGVLDWIEGVETGGTGVATTGRRAPVLQATQAALIDQKR